MFNDFVYMYMSLSLVDVNAVVYVLSQLTSKEEGDGLNVMHSSIFNCSRASINIPIPRFTLVVS